MTPPGGLELEVESVAVGGDGVAREESGRVVFVPRTAPGDRVRARLVEEKGSYARARATEVLRSGPERRVPPCPHYGACGGCQLQHLSYRGQLTAKRRAVADTLERIGGRPVDVPPVVPSERRLGYRNRVTFTLRRPDAPGRGRAADGDARAGGADADGVGADGVVAGYHRWDAPERLVDVDRCPLAEPPVNRAWRQLRRTWGPGAERLPAGRELRVTIRASARGEVTVLVEREASGPGRGPGPGPGDAGPPDAPADAGPSGARSDGGDDAGDPDAVARAVDDLSGYFFRPPGGERRLLAGRDRMAESWQGVELSLGPETFLQVNRTMARRMEAWLDRRLRDRAGGPKGLRILDLYAGVGTRALRWARAGADAAACEVDEEAVASGRAAAREAGVDPDLRPGRVEDRLASLLPADVAVVNPPRQGLSEEAAAGLGEASLEAMAYVSCDPATLARDLDRLGPGWEVASLRAFDAFPQTSHVETLAWLEPA